MTERNPDSNRFRIRRPRMRRAPEIETATGGLGMAAMATATAFPEKSEEITGWSPVGIYEIANIASKIGVSEQVTFTGLTIFFGLATMHGVYRIRRRQNRNPQS